MIALFASAGAILFAILLVFMAKRKIAVCGHNGKVVDEAYGTDLGEIVVVYVCDDCGEKFRSLIWREDPLAPPGLASDL